MFLVIEERLSELPCVERVWTAHSERADEFLSVAAANCELVVSRYRDQMFLTVRGPETRMTTIDCPAEGEWLGIRLKLGTFLPQFPPASLSDRRDVRLPDARRGASKLGHAPFASLKPMTVVAAKVMASGSRHCGL